MWHKGLTFKLQSTGRQGTLLSLQNDYTKDTILKVAISGIYSSAKSTNDIKTNILYIYQQLFSCQYRSILLYSDL